MAWRRIYTTTGPTDTPVDPSELRDQVTLEIPDDDALLQRLIEAATDHAENITHRRIMSQQVRMVLPDFPPLEIILPFGKAISVQGISYIDSGGNTVELSGPSDSPAGTDWQEDLNDDEEPIILPNSGESWPSADPDRIRPVWIDWTAGYSADASEVPAALRHAILMQAAKWYEAKWDGEAPLQVENMFLNALGPFKLIRYGD